MGIFNFARQHAFKCPALYFPSSNNKCISKFRNGFCSINPNLRGSSKVEEASDLFQKAGHSYKIAKKWAGKILNMLSSSN